MKSMVSKNKVVFDANVLLNILLPDREDHAVAIKLAETIKEVPCATPLSVHLVFYFGKKAGVPFDDLVSFCSSFDIIEMSWPEVNWAMHNCMDGDFEDALQLASAMSAKCTKFYTFDKKLAKAYKNKIDIELL